MAEHGQQRRDFDADVYDQTMTQIRRLKPLLREQSVETLAREVIRRLADRKTEDDVEAPQRATIERLCRALTSDDDWAASAMIEDIRATGASLEVIYLKYLTAAARLLGEWWNRDRMTFTEVMLGTSRIYSIMRTLRGCVRERVFVEREALFASVPGERHTLGVQMAADLFRQDGWRIELLTNRDHDELVAEIVAAEAGLIGLSASGANALDALTRLVLAIRIERPCAAIFVGGHIVAEAGDKLALLDIEGMAADLNGARAVLDRLWSASHRDALH